LVLGDTPSFAQKSTTGSILSTTSTGVTLRTLLAVAMDLSPFQW
jgi:hypothetical protein